MSQWEDLNTISLELLSILFLHHGTQRRVLISTPASPTEDTELPASPYLKTGIYLSLYSQCIYTALLNLWSILVPFWQRLPGTRSDCQNTFLMFVSFHLLSEGFSVFPWHFCFQNVPHLIWLRNLGHLHRFLHRFLIQWKRYNEIPLKTNWSILYH